MAFNPKKLQLITREKSRHDLREIYTYSGGCSFCYGEENGYKVISFPEGLIDQDLSRSC